MIGESVYHVETSDFEQMGDENSRVRAPLKCKIFYCRDSVEKTEFYQVGEGYCKHISRFSS